VPFLLIGERVGGTYEGAVWGFTDDKEEPCLLAVFEVLLVVVVEGREGGGFTTGVVEPFLLFDGEVVKARSRGG